MLKWIGNWIAASQFREADRLEAEAEELTARAARLRERAGRLVAINKVLIQAQLIAGNRAVQEAAEKRGIKRHPKLEERDLA